MNGPSPDDPSSASAADSSMNDLGDFRRLRAATVFVSKLNTPGID
jgi:hypothetical protein